MSPVDETVRRAIEALKSEGFCITTEIDVTATPRKKVRRRVPP